MFAAIITQIKTLLNINSPMKILNRSLTISERVEANLAPRF